MERAGYISHDQFPADICVQSVWTGENVGEAYGSEMTAVLLLHHIMMDEGPCPHAGCPGAEKVQHGHYLNLINPRFTEVGIGVVEQSHTVWLTEDFLS
jgi:hypothetical protein